MTDDVEAAEAGAPSDDGEDFYARTKFWRAARRYGLRDLILTGGSGVAVAAAGAVLALYLCGSLRDDGLRALGVAYISLGAALFGIVLAGLAVVAAFFDRAYVLELREGGTLDQALFGFWWVAALAVVSLLASVTMTAVVYAKSSEGVTAVALTVATALFVAALLEALTLVGTLMRHGLYRAELMARREQSGGRRRGTDQS